MSATIERPYLLTSVGKKMVMGITGLIWAGFVFSHMAGNMLILVSPEAYNTYGHMITSGVIVYPAEFILVLSFLLHVGCAVSLVRGNMSARGGQRYAMPTNGEKAVTPASKTMAIHGSLILAFIISHIATFKYGIYYETTAHGVVMRDLHRLVMEVFRQPGFLFWYLLCLILLGFHLSHGVGSIFQSLGIRNDRMAPVINKVSVLYGLIVALGFIVQPLYVFFTLGNR